MAASLSELNERFGAGGHVAFEAGRGGLTMARIANPHGSATVALLGAHVTAYQPAGHEPVLWVSEQSHYEVGKSIRGGIPVCWPWFGGHPTDSTKPAHGFVRMMLWDVLGAEALRGDATRLRLGLTDSPQTRALWPHTFAAEVVVTLGERLVVELIARNPGRDPYTFGGALHSYFRVGNASDIAIRGLEGCRYLDKVIGFAPRVQDGPVTISQEVDRVYVDTYAECTIEDPGLGRRIRIAKDGSRTTVVWNPWIEKSLRMEDFGDDEYRGMVCVETANAHTDTHTLPPGGEHRLCARIKAEKA